MEPQIGFCINPDGIRIAYATFGQGPALLCTTDFGMSIKDITHFPSMMRSYERGGRYHTIVVYDHSGTGLSGRNRTDFTLEAFVRDMETVIGHLKLDRLILYGMSGGGPMAMAYAARHPQNITHLALFNTSAYYDLITSADVRSSMVSLYKNRFDFAMRGALNLMFPGASAAFTESLIKMLADNDTPDTYAQYWGKFSEFDVRDILPSIHMPVLVLHRKGYFIPMQAGLELASLIPNARFVLLEGNEFDPAQGAYTSWERAILEFLGDPVTTGQAVESVKPVARDTIIAADDSATQEARSLIGDLDHVVLSRYCVVGKFTRYDEAVRNMLKDAYHKIAAGFNHPGQKRENHIIWAAPGSGKTFFVQQVAASLQPMIHYHELNLAKCSREEFLAGLSRLDAVSKPCICLIDEADARPKETWPYEMLLPYLDANVERAAPYVFVLVGSSGSNLVEIKKLIASRPKGADLLSRIPAENEYAIPPLILGDRLLVVLSQFRNAGQESGREIREVEKLGLYYIALNSRLSDARQLRELAVRAIERMPVEEDRVKYDHLFGAGDPENKAFWMKTLPETEELANRFVTIEN